MKRILVPCDFSKPAEEAFKFAVMIAERSGGEIHVLNVVDITAVGSVPSIADSYVFNLDFLKERALEVEAKFKEMLSRNAAWFPRVVFKHVVSSLEVEIKDYIKSQEIDLIIMGTRGNAGAFFGSNTQRVVRHATVPVIGVHTAPAKIEQIVFPIGSDVIDDALVAEVKKLQELFDATLHLLHINTPMLLRPDHLVLKDLQQLAKSHDLHYYRLSVRADFNVEAGIARYARDVDAQLIAMGTHAWKGLLRLVLGSVTEDVVNDLSLPVWSYAMK
jgi:nucleotide-binding universal stress UspA family protein